MIDLVEKRTDFMSKLNKGGSVCACCDRFGKRYPRPLDVSMATALIRLYKFQKKGIEWVNYADAGKGFPGFATLRWWGLIEAKPKDDNQVKKKTSGFWRITEKGQLFVTQKIAVPSHVFVYNNEMGEGEFTPKEIYISSLAGKKFNYEELMNS